MENRSLATGEESNRKATKLFQDFQNLQRIWSAPKALRYNSDRYEIEMQRKRDLESDDESEGSSIKDFLADSESAASTSSGGETDDDDDDDDDGQSINSDETSKKKNKKKKKKEKKDGNNKVAPLPRRTRAMVATSKLIFQFNQINIYLIFYLFSSIGNIGRRGKRGGISTKVR